MGSKGEEISSVIKQKIVEFNKELSMVDSGVVVEVGDGIAQVHGLSGVGFNELVEFDGGAYGMALNLEEDGVGIVILGDPKGIKEGTEVRGTGRVVEVPVGEGLIGRVVNALGEPIDGKGSVESSVSREIELVAPNVAIRKSVDTPLQTGIKSIDAMVPVGRGQRELIIGDRSTGKTSVAVDAIINQKSEDVVCIYVAIGQKAGKVAQTVGLLESHGAMDHTIVIAANASDPAPLTESITTLNFLSLILSKSMHFKDAQLMVCLWIAFFSSQSIPCSEISIFSFEKLSAYSKRFSQSYKLKKVLSSFTNLIPFHSMGLWLAVIITPPIASVV